MVVVDRVGTGDRRAVCGCRNARLAQVQRALARKPGDSKDQPVFRPIPMRRFPLHPPPKRMRILRLYQAAPQHSQAIREDTHPYPMIRIGRRNSADRISERGLLSYWEENFFLHFFLRFLLQVQQHEIKHLMRGLVRNLHFAETSQNTQHPRQARSRVITQKRFATHKKSPGLRRGSSTSQNAISKDQNVMLQLSMRPVSALELSLTRSRQLPLIVSADRFTL